MPLRAVLVREPVSKFAHRIPGSDGREAECVTQRPAGVCPCGAFALDWVPLPPARPGAPA